MLCRVVAVISLPVYQIIFLVLWAHWTHYAPNFEKVGVHIAFDLCVRSCMGVCVTRFMPIVTFEP